MTRLRPGAGALLFIFLSWVPQAVLAGPGESGAAKVQRSERELRGRADRFAASIRRGLEAAGVVGVSVSTADVRAAMDSTTLVTMEDLLSRSRGHAACGAMGCSAMTMPNGDGTFGIAFDAGVMDANPYDAVGALVAHELTHAILERKGLSAESQHAVTCAMGVGGGVHHGHTDHDCARSTPGGTHVSDATSVERPRGAEWASPPGRRGRGTGGAGAAR